MKRDNKAGLLPTTIALAASLALAAATADAKPQGAGRTVAAGTTWTVQNTTRLATLDVGGGAHVAAPQGHSLTLTVDGVERDLQPGHYSGRIVLTVTDAVPVKFNETMTHPFRQAIYLDAKGVVASKSVLAAAGRFTLKDGVLAGATIRSDGENFNGIYVTGGHYTLKGLVLDFEGNGGNDFAGYGAGVMSTGKDTTLVLDGAKVSTHGAVRTTVIGNGGSNLVVKNSEISSRTGVLPANYVSNVTPGEMKDAPWMLGIKGNVRATNVLGDDTTCTYINSHISSDGWGVLSIDMSRNTRLTAIDSLVELTGDSGYGSYAIGNSTNSFYGTKLHAPTHGVIITGGHAVFGASTPATVARLNGELRLGLSAAELAALPTRQTVVESARFGVMMWGDATVKVTDATVFDTGEAVFLDKGAPSDIDVDGAGGAQLNTRNGVLFQAIDNDDPGPQMTGGLMVNSGVYREPAEAPAKLGDFDLAAVHKSDMRTRFSHIALKGDFFNAIRDIAVGGGMDENGGMHPPTGKAGSNLVVSLVDATLTGNVTASTAHHVKNPIAAADFQSLAEVTNTPGPAINNGVIVSLQHSVWTVTGTSYLTSLTIDDGSALKSANGAPPTLTVDGVAVPLHSGVYKGQIVVQAAR